MKVTIDIDMFQLDPERLADGQMEFIKRNQKAIMDTKTGAISLYVDGTRVAEQPFKVDTSIKASAFFALLDEMFAKY